MKIEIRVFDKVKYDPESKEVARIPYSIKSYSVEEISDEEIFAEGFDEVDPYGEYLIIRTMDDEFATFRNSYVDVFYI